MYQFSKFLQTQMTGVMDKQKQTDTDLCLLPAATLKRKQFHSKNKMAMLHNDK